VALTVPSVVMWISYPPAYTVVPVVLMRTIRFPSASYTFDVSPTVVSSSSACAGAELAKASAWGAQRHDPCSSALDWRLMVLSAALKPDQLMLPPRTSGR